jgi:hypothetical protein
MWALLVRLSLTMHGTSPRREKHGKASGIAGERRGKKGVAVWQDLPQRLTLRKRRETQPKAAAGHTSAAFAPTARARQPYFEQACIILVPIYLSWMQRRS